MGRLLHAGYCIHPCNMFHTVDMIVQLAKCCIVFILILKILQYGFGHHQFLKHAILCIVDIMLHDGVFQSSGGGHQLYT